MKKKIKDLTFKEADAICNIYRNNGQCDRDCPLRIAYERNYCKSDKEVLKKYGEEEVELIEEV